MMGNNTKIDSSSGLPNCSRVNATYHAGSEIDMCFNAGHVVSIVVYSILLVVSAIGNTTVLLIVCRKRASKSRIHTMLMHLAIADLLVTFLIMPLEIGWAITVSWKAGDAMCRIMAFFRMFGLYLSSFILVCISMDRYYAVIRPLQLWDVDRRGKIMLSFAWIGSVVCSVPQIIIFHVEAHPVYARYLQCVTFNVFPTHTHLVSYTLFGMLMMYWFPLLVIIYAYISILLEICKRSKKSEVDKIRRSSVGFLTRAKIRTLKMTVIIVAVFFICWTPYYVMSLWYWIDKDSAKNVDQRIQKGLFLFACTNSCMNPIVYGAFNIRDRHKPPVRPTTIETRVTPLSLSLKLLD
ncbi:PREDICTED: gonadotropin-releasing hormone II receptor [Habropoda laboriosa]|uniref:gonadotropin-releasing hormone II receptor n=1 Tax=Habropoda laboriosa TaxID=597456 RepID=UPI00083D7347|nr:PREDICTED: gonadotropin-releasing hormone II receptor [Habropoda laboriosa]